MLEGKNWGQVKADTVLRAQPLQPTARFANISHKVLLIPHRALHDVPLLQKEELVYCLLASLAPAAKESLVDLATELESLTLGRGMAASEAKAAEAEAGSRRNSEDSKGNDSALFANRCLAFVHEVAAPLEDVANSMRRLRGLQLELLLLFEPNDSEMKSDVGTSDASLQRVFSILHEFGLVFHQAWGWAVDRRKRRNDRKKRGEAKPGRSRKVDV
jgi:hypothetical protein